MNNQVGKKWSGDYPPGMQERLVWRRYGGLSVGLLARQDLIALKLHAAVDREGPESVHYQDLLFLGPSDTELEWAAGWVRKQDIGSAFPKLVQDVIEHVRKDLGRSGR
ncbi:MAG: hypothetical protein HY720_22265 [Planctomycetes bacterium]|nr:hypothetical protein [Planctomycetota bacterium]